MKHLNTKKNQNKKAHRAQTAQAQQLEHVQEPPPNLLPYDPNTTVVFPWKR